MPARRSLKYSSVFRPPRSVSASIHCRCAAATSSSRRLSFDDYASMFHGNDERVDIESLVLSTKLWDGLARDILT